MVVQLKLQLQTVVLDTGQPASEKSDTVAHVCC